jgi:hypothetical protein
MSERFNEVESAEVIGEKEVIKDPFGDVLVTPADVKAYVENGGEGVTTEMTELSKKGEVTISSVE